jgi:hypothetical protein
MGRPSVHLPTFHRRYHIKYGSHCPDNTIEDDKTLLDREYEDHFREA